MTDRLYYSDAYMLTFPAAVTACREGKAKDTWEIALNRSAFYPTSGGQPHDTGWLRADGDAFRVTEVETDRAGEVWHTVPRAIPVGTAVCGTIDRERRMDHMEQHGGEHMLAGAIWEKLGGTTIGLHLGQEDSSIDVDMPDGRTHLTEEEIILLEDTVNDRIRLDAPIRCWFPTPEELEKLPLRKKPTVNEHVRIVAMGDFEMVACGGTHPASAGRIGQLKILSAIPARGKIRVRFVCGGRACRMFRTYMRCADKAGNVLSAPTERLASAAGELIRRLAETEKKLHLLETEQMLSEICKNESTDDLPGVALSVTRFSEGDAGPVNAAVSAYIAEGGRALLMSVGGRLLFARSADVEIDMNELIRRVGRGGGRPDWAGGAGIPECADVARKILMTEGKGRTWRKKS